MSLADENLDELYGDIDLERPDSNQEEDDTEYLQILAQTQRSMKAESLNDSNNQYGLNDDDMSQRAQFGTTNESIIDYGRPRSIAEYSLQLPLPYVECKSKYAVRINIPPEMTDRALEHLFQAYGRICKITFLEERNGRSAGEALIQFENDEEAANAAKEVKMSLLNEAQINEWLREAKERKKTQQLNVRSNQKVNVNTAITQNNVNSTSNSCNNNLNSNPNNNNSVSNNNVNSTSNYGSGGGGGGGGSSSVQQPRVSSSLNRSGNASRVNSRSGKSKANESGNSGRMFGDFGYSDHRDRQYGGAGGDGRRHERDYYGGMIDKAREEFDGGGRYRWYENERAEERHWMDDHYESRHKNNDIDEKHNIRIDDRYEKHMEEKRYNDKNERRDEVRYREEGGGGKGRSKIRKGEKKSNSNREFKNRSSKHDYPPENKKDKKHFNEHFETRARNTKSKVK